MFGCCLFAALVIFYCNIKSNKNVPQIKSEESQKLHFRFDIPVWNPEETCAENDSRDVCKECLIKVVIFVVAMQIIMFFLQPDLWDCVGEDRTWGMVFVDNRPASKRGPNALRLVKRAQIIVTHDSQYDDAFWPQDWVHSR